ncbi:branched-chain amino acid ABC transporter substrate-binding protein [Nocardioides marmoriginsengisoli]|uniref:Branched-chain amino acid ABC transporter substrate-binding protein n=1 Tax=Nocardioides marmoriginsengisoli TaxID=661483 RepID=A0A3N0CEN4_9ACTN|nr:branched-chain amino acid ABC transporter substrate-binding protein [Nocardioides marmoriginsengisoli]RNL61914.1 branched-chain amino acid ABC transporter substrate-binding protein [Nocardioides marmoriginsengisoli]
MNSNRAVRLGALGLAVSTSLLGLAACGSDDAGGGSGAIKVGVLAPMSGSVSADGEDMVRASKLVVEKVNADGGIDGRKIELVVADDACEAQQGTQAAQKLVTDKVVAVVGGFCSSAALPASEVFHRNGDLPFVASVSSNPKLTDAKYPGITRYIGRDDQEAPVTADYVADLLASKKVAIMNDNTEYSRAVAKSLKENIEKKGTVEIVYDDAIQPGQNDYRAALGRVARDGADTLVYTGFYPEFGILAKQWAQLKPGYRLVGGASSIDATVLTAAPDAVTLPDLSIISYPTASLIQNPQADEFRTEYKAKYDADPGQFGIFQHDAMQGLVAALKADPKKLDAKDLIKRLRDVSFEGITGDISFDDQGDRNAFPFLAVRSVDGKFAPAYSYSPDSGWAATN